MIDYEGCECAERLCAQVRRMGEKFIGKNSTALAGLTCGEAYEFFKLFVLAGHVDLALSALLEHAMEDDDPGDEHHGLYQALAGARDEVNAIIAVQEAANVVDEIRFEEEDLPRFAE